MTVISRITPAAKPGNAGVEALHGGEIQVPVKGPNLGAWAKQIRGL